MTTEEMRIALAESVGLKLKEHKGTIWCVSDNQFFGSWKTGPNSWYGPLPKLTLDWMHEVESTLTDDEKNSYAFEAIHDVVTRDHHKVVSGFKFLHASAMQRAEAYLRVKGLWR